MNISETYIVINSLLVSKLKQIKHFELNLGTSLLNGAKQFLPSDVKIQKHYIYFNENILLVGYIGSLAFYTNNRLNTTFIELYNEKDVLIYALTGIDLYSDINLALDQFIKKYETVKPNIVPEIKEEVKQEEYIKPNKKLSELSLEERIAYVRNNR